MPTPTETMSQDQFREYFHERLEEYFQELDDDETCMMLEEWLVTIGQRTLDDA